MVNLRSVDLNLLTVFEAVYEERSQVRAAQRLGMTQPAISNALGRLRHLVGDRLFQGRAKGLVATAKADDLYKSIHAALDLVRGEIDSPDEFDPASSRQTFVVTITYGAGSLMGLPLFRLIREAAPAVRLVIRSIDPDEEIPSLLREQRLDLAFHHGLLDDPVLVQTPFASFSGVIVARADHPRIERAVTSTERLLEEEFVGVFDNAQTLAQNPALKPIVEVLRDRVALEVPSTSLLPLMLARTDLVAIMSRQLAEAVADIYGLKHYPVPFEVPPVPIYIIWHPSRRSDPGHRWLREQCLRVAEALQIQECPGSPAAA